MPTINEEIDMAFLMSALDERVYIKFGLPTSKSNKKEWFYVVKRPSGKVNIDFEIVDNADIAFNIIQKRNIELAKEKT